MKCAVKDCYNHTQDGGFVDSLCVPCYNFAIGEGDTHSQAYRNSKKTFTELLVREQLGIWERMDNGNKVEGYIEMEDYPKAVIKHFGVSE